MVDSKKFIYAGMMFVMLALALTLVATGPAAHIAASPLDSVLAAGTPAEPTNTPVPPAATNTALPPAATSTSAPPAATNTAAVPGATATAAGASPSGTLEADDQAAGSSIVVRKVVAGQDGWVAVHVNTTDNKPGAVIGVAPVKKGENDNVTVKLDPTPKAGDKLWPMLHIDAGTIGTYEFPGPDAPVIVDGNIVMKQITLTAAAAEASPTAAMAAATPTEAAMIPAPTPAPSTSLPSTGAGGSSLIILLIGGMGLLLIVAGIVMSRRPRKA